MTTLKGSATKKRQATKAKTGGGGTTPEVTVLPLSAEQLAQLEASIRAGEEAVSKAEQTVAATQGTSEQSFERSAIDSEGSVGAAVRAVAESVSGEVDGKV